MRRFAETSAVLALVLAVYSGCTSSSTTSGVPAGFHDVLQEDAGSETQLVSGDALELSVEVDGGMEVALHRAKVDSRGIATLPLVGEVEVGGMTLEQAREIIAMCYSVYYVNPPVIMLASVEDGEVGEWGRITVLGRVRQPGVVPLSSSRGINLTAAIQAAGGFAPSAKTSGIRVWRTFKDGTKTRVSVNFDDIGRLGKAEADLKLIDGDIVDVPERIF